MKKNIILATLLLATTVVSSYGSGSEDEPVRPTRQVRPATLRATPRVATRTVAESPAAASLEPVMPETVARHLEERAEISPPSPRSPHMTASPQSTTRKPSFSEPASAAAAAPETEESPKSKYKTTEFARSVESTKAILAEKKISANLPKPKDLFKRKANPKNPDQPRENLGELGACVDYVVSALEIEDTQNLTHGSKVCKKTLGEKYTAYVKERIEEIETRQARQEAALLTLTGHMGAFKSAAARSILRKQYTKMMEKLHSDAESEDEEESQPQHPEVRTGLQREWEQAMQAEQFSNQAEWANEIRLTPDEAMKNELSDIEWMENDHVWIMKNPEEEDHRNDEDATPSTPPTRQLAKEMRGDSH